MQYVLALAVGIGGWVVTHLLATWRQTAANQSEWRWKLLNVYSDFISSCNKTIDRADQLRNLRREADKHPPDALPDELSAKLHQANENWYIARAEVGSSTVLLKLLEPGFNHQWQSVLDKLDNFAKQIGDHEADNAFKDFMHERDRLVKVLHEDLVRTWRPTGAIDIIKYRYQRWRYWLKQRSEKAKARETSGESAD